MHEAILYETGKEKSIVCHVCPRNCRVKPDREGYCKVRGNRDGKFYSLVYGLCSSVAVDPIEKKPVFHFRPGTRVLSLGTIGCNLRCIHCQNWQIAYGQANDVDGLTRCDPANTAALAREYGCEGVAWTYNEPTIWLEHTIDSAMLCKEAGLYTVYVTNGYITREALDAIAPHLDVYRVDIKAFNREAYRKLSHIPSYEPILEAAIRAKKHWGLHVEIVTNIIPTINDDDDQLAGIAQWIVTNLGADVPWHVTRFYPYLELTSLPATPIATIEKAREIGMAKGLGHVYVGNVPGHVGENTYCPKCGALAIRRTGYAVKLEAVDDSRCSSCQTPLSIRF